MAEKWVRSYYISNVWLHFIVEIWRDGVEQQKTKVSY